MKRWHPLASSILSPSLPFVTPMSLRPRCGDTGGATTGPQWNIYIVAKVGNERRGRYNANQTFTHLRGVHIGFLHCPTFRPMTTAKRHRQCFDDGGSGGCPTIWTGDYVAFRGLRRVRGARRAERQDAFLLWGWGVRAGGQNVSAASVPRAVSLV